MSSLKAYIILARPHHYIKNLFVFVPLFFAHELMNADLLVLAAQGFISFCLAASAVYVFNDIIDVKDDRNNLLKRSRPLAAEKISRKQAAGFFVALCLAASLSSFFSGVLPFFLIIIVYILLNAAYSLLLKKIIIIDVICVATGFVLRVLAGSLLINKPLSCWLAVMTFLLALFMAFAKRRCDMTAGYQNDTDNSLYSISFLSKSLWVLAVINTLCYLAYTMSAEVMAEHNTDNLYFSAIWVALGIIRYLAVVYDNKQACSPVRTVLTDIYLQLCVVLWAGTLWVLIYTDLL